MRLCWAISFFATNENLSRIFFYKIWFQYIFQDNDEPEDEALETQEPVGVAEDNQCPDPNMEDQELEGNITLF